MSLWLSNISMMAPQRTRKQKSGDSAAADATTAGPSITFAADTADGAATPQRSPSKQRPTITQAQKQALIDNLQLESKYAGIIRLQSTLSNLFQSLSELASFVQFTLSTRKVFVRDSRCGSIAFRNHSVLQTSKNSSTNTLSNSPRRKRSLSLLSLLWPNHARLRNNYLPNRVVQLEERSEQGKRAGRT